MPHPLPRAKPEPTVLITGASTGIGAACALHLDQAGFRVFAGVRQERDGAALRVRASSRLQSLQLDVTDQLTIDGARREIEVTVGGAGLDGLVNNAGTAVAGPLEVLPLAALRRQLEINLIGQIAVTQAFLPLLRTARGRIVNMGSIAGRAVTPFLGPYSASKFALEAVTDALRMELAPWGIEVAIIEPGAIATPIWTKSAAHAGELQEQTIREAPPLYREQMVRFGRTIQRVAERAAPVELVNRAVEHALTARRPKTRYLVGRDARIQRLIGVLLSDRARDRLVQRFFRLVRQA
jgi:NAD(P)-dependent dehydrogenase (short-subunit alcohol dehydrogenase family)